MIVTPLTLDRSLNVLNSLLLHGEGVALGNRGRYGTIARDTGDIEGNLFGARDA